MISVFQSASERQSNRSKQRKQRVALLPLSSLRAQSRLAPGRINRETSSVNLGELKLMIKPSGISSSFI